MTRTTNAGAARGEGIKKKKKLDERRGWWRAESCSATVTFSLWERLGATKERLRRVCGVNGGNGQRSWRRARPKCLLIVSASSPFDDGDAVVVFLLPFRGKRGKAVQCTPAGW